MYLQELIIFKELASDPITNKYLNLLEASNPAEIRKAYFDLVKDLIAKETSFETHLYEKMMEVDNTTLERLGHQQVKPGVLDIACLRNDLEILKHMVTQDVEPILSEVNDKQNILAHIGNAPMKSARLQAYHNYFHKEIFPEDDEDILQFVELLRLYGTGTFACNQVFYINRQEQLTPIRKFSPLPWDEIYDYQTQKEALLKNTKALVEGRPFHHVILEGASGTGKSSSVKAVVDLFTDQKLRLIQIYKSQLQSLPSILDMISGSIFKFIIFIDDLSFESHDDDYKILKSYIEGGILNESNNIAFYVTSNRMHLIQQMRSEREGDMRINDFIQETTSLSARFGLHLTFVKPDQKAYFSMIAKMLKKEQIEIPQREMELEAKRWSMKHNGMSGRIAMQFVKHVKMNK